MIPDAASDLATVDVAGARAVFVSPHLDDVALSCGGRVARGVALGEAPVVVSVFTRGPDDEEPLSELAKSLHASWGDRADDVWRVRRDEDAQAMRALGARRVWLGHRDALYRGYDTREALTGAVRRGDPATNEGIARALVALSARADRPTIFLPLAVGGHVDHRLCAALSEPLRQSGLEVVHYEDFPYVVKSADAIASRAGELGATRSSTEDITEHIATRVAAISCYASQLAMLERWTGPCAEAVRAHAASVSGVPGIYAERFWR
jgi:LmbE family N-acetylglucosaminyl deacetylase